MPKQANTYMWIHVYVAVIFRFCEDHATVAGVYTRFRLQFLNGTYICTCTTITRYLKYLAHIHAHA